MPHSTAQTDAYLHDSRFTSSRLAVPRDESNHFFHYTMIAGESDNLGSFVRKNLNAPTGPIVHRCGQKKGRFGGSRSREIPAEFPSIRPAGPG